MRGSNTRNTKIIMVINAITTLIIIAAIGTGLYILFTALKRALVDAQPKNDGQSLLLLQQQINEVARIVDGKLAESTRLAQAGEHMRNELIRNVSEHLTRLQESNKQVLNFTDQLKNLQDILKNPKQRGILGEYFLETVLKNVLPPNTFKLQYPFKNGTIVDAVVLVKDKIIPIDSKFSLENYNRLLEATNNEERTKYEEAVRNDLKIRIDETAKYVQPEEGTMEFAFMFIPAEALYYDLLVNKIGAVKSSTRDLIEYAVKDKKVIVVSPTSFLAYLQTVLQGLRALQIEDSAKEIRKRVEELGRHLLNYEGYFNKVGAHLGTTINMYNSASKELGKIDKDVLRISGGVAGLKPELIEGTIETHGSE